jgi:hypothetical protein
MTLSSTTRNQEFQELISDLKNLVNTLDSADNGTVMVDRLYKLKATATEAIEFLKDDETSAVDKPVNR